LLLQLPLLLPPLSLLLLLLPPVHPRIFPPLFGEIASLSMAAIELSRRVFILSKTRRDNSPRSFNAANRE